MPAPAPKSHSARVYIAEKVWVQAWCGLHDTMLIAGPEIQETRQVQYGEAVCPAVESPFRLQCMKHWFFRVVIEPHAGTST